MTLLLALLFFLWLRSEARLKPGETEQDRIDRLQPVAYTGIAGCIVLGCMGLAEAIYWVMRLS